MLVICTNGLFSKPFLSLHESNRCTPPAVQEITIRPVLPFKTKIGMV